jgi:uncharacterized LabA/DUF88 family protein
MAFMAQVEGEVMAAYLFVDGAYLRERLDHLAQRYFGGQPLPIDYRSLFGAFEKVFYFDCTPPRRGDETEDAFKAREKGAEARFRILRRLPGCHVFLGQTKNQRQKGVDVQLAVQALVHVFRHNTREITVLSGDSDFKPLVDALVLEGAYVTLAYEPRSTARELIDAADAQWVLWPHIVFRYTTDAFRAEHGLPADVARIAYDPRQEWADLGANWLLISEGQCSTGRVCVYREQGGRIGALLCRAPEDDRYYWLMHSRNEDVLQKIAEDI